MLKLEFVHAFAAIAEGGSMTIAAQRLALSKHVVRRI
jgi:DNA-binding transcriptional LysR family regulator